MKRRRRKRKGEIEPNGGDFAVGGPRWGPSGDMSAVGDPRTVVVVVVVAVVVV